MATFDSNLDAAANGGGGGGGEDLAATLVLGNITGGTDIVISSGDTIRGAGGNARGTNAVDLQLSRAAATQVAATSDSALVGGRNNTIGNNTFSDFTGIFAGSGNTIDNQSAYGSVILGGGSNT